MISNTLTFRRE